MFGRKKEQSLGEMLNSPEAPKPQESRAEMSFDDWDQKAAARGEWASKKVGELKEKAQKLWGGLKGRMKKGVGWAMTAPEMAGHAAATTKEAVSEKMTGMANIDYDRNTRPDGGKLESFLASLDDKSDEIKASMLARYDSAKDMTSAKYGQFKEGYYNTLDSIDDAEERLQAKMEAGLKYVDQRAEQAYNKFTGFLKYHSPAQRRARATEAAQQQVESLQTERAVTNISAKDLMSLLKNCEKLGVPISGIKIEIGDGPEAYEKKQTEAAAAA